MPVPAATTRCRPCSRADATASHISRWPGRLSPPPGIADTTESSASTASCGASTAVTLIGGKQEAASIASTASCDASTAADGSRAHFTDPGAVGVYDGCPLRDDLGLLDHHALRVGCEIAQILEIACEYNPVGFGHGNDDRVHCRYL